MRKPYICVAKQDIQQIIRTAGENFFHSNSYYVNQKSRERPDREIGSLPFFCVDSSDGHKKGGTKRTGHGLKTFLLLLYYIYIYIYIFYLIIIVHCDI